MLFWVVGLAGIVGALLRYYLGIVVNFWSVGHFPLATFTANLIGSFVLGWLTSRLSRLKSVHPYIPAAIGTGLIGSFTTFSTFSVETVTLIRSSLWETALVYVLLSLWGGLLLSWLGVKTGCYPRKDRGGLNG